MGTALVLLFLLALGAIPGALLPQRSLNDGQGRPVHRRPPDDRAVAGPAAGLRRVLQLLVHRDLRAAVHLAGRLPDPADGRARPQPARHAGAGAAQPGPAAQAPHRRGRGRRRRPSPPTASRAADAAGAASPAARATTVEISAEKGYLREFGNLVFHFSLLGLLVAVAVGKLFGYEGNVIVIADGGPGFCSASPAAFDSFRAGNTVDGTSLNPICLRVNDFEAHYLPRARPPRSPPNIDYQAGADLNSDTWRPYRLEVNHPLRIGGDRVYLQGHGYAPTFTVTFPDGQTRTQTVQWRPDDPLTLLSSGVIRVDPPGGTYPDADERRKHQIAIQGLFAPTEQLDGTLLSSSFPALNDPAVAVDIYRGDTGLDTGRPQSLFSLDPRLIEQKRLTKVRRGSTCAPGEEIRLDDGTVVRFDGAVPFVNLQVSHDPAQVWVLVFALTMMAGLLVSLMVRRRRVWVRITRAGRRRYGERRAGRPGPHRQFRVGRRVRAADRAAAGGLGSAEPSREKAERA